ncbi:ScbA/BarX family gamma-butyrolactone biosynthesis protein [Micromonospora sp. KC723]|uniref:ScbA/BarX family gamma-butyrolactone biosynthesis protein n=1 Tax=Micromonospora sp. KC723 TaxID=2530381 RepID=UPI00104ED125|nr:ScbA/BarX family gamma-butyrolactone biosynthesis protein [Micromonospora sp. KC723]TDB78133.1 hypothetical protein E1165_02000 [Micromonospora sp. KC723]
MSYESTVPRRLVHRAAAAEVLLTDWCRTDADTFACAVQWPRGHSLYGAQSGRFHPLLVAETIRQCGILIAHVGYAVPMGHAFLMQRLRWMCDPDGLFWADGPLQSIALIEITELTRRPDGTIRMRVDVRLERDGRQFAAGSGWLRCVTPAVYQRLRRQPGDHDRGAARAVPPATPATVGRELIRDVVVGPTDDDGVRMLRVVKEHPILFDHPLDHVPGMLVFEAMHQVAVAEHEGAATAITASEASFPAFLELNQPCRIVVDRPAPDALAMRFLQGGRVAVHGTVTVTPPSRATAPRHLSRLVSADAPIPHR